MCQQICVSLTMIPVFQKHASHVRLEMIRFYSTKLPIKIIFLAKFPHIRLSVTEDNVLDALALITSIPFPENEETKPMALNKVFILVQLFRRTK